MSPRSLEQALRASLVGACATLCAALASGQESSDQVRVEVRVTSLVADGLYLDAGREQGLEPGDLVRLFPPGASQVEARIVSISRSNARARFVSTGAGVTVGTPGEVRVPRKRIEPAPAPEEQPPAPAPEVGGQAPVVPPPARSGEAQSEDEAAPQAPVEWSAPPEQWDSELPLLAPAKPVEPGDRDVDWRGSTYVTVQTIDDEGASTTLARAGLDAEVQNLFGRGGVLQLDLEAFSRTAELDDQPDEDDSRVRLDRFSYRWGGLREEPMGWEVGRFLQRGMPEFGVLDGAEWSWRTDSGDVFGASVGFLPEPTPEMKTGEDLQVAASWRRRLGLEDAWAVGLGVQKTWNDGEADRDLVIGTLDWTPGPDLSLHGSAWVDVYGSSEAVKSSGPELTEAHLSLVNRLSQRSGFNLFASHLQWPDIARNEFRSVSLAELADYEVSRLGLNLWRDLGSRTRLSARADLWSDADEDGLGGELRWALRDAFQDGGELALALFTNDGRFSSVTGLRATVRGTAGQGFWNLGLESGLFEQDDFFGDQGELWQHLVRGGYDRALGQRWDLSIWGDQRLGDEQGATTLGLSLRRRF